MDIQRINKLGFGTSQIGGPSLIDGKLTGCKPIPEEDALRILRYAYDHGINFFDTSDKYGNAEYLLGKAFIHDRDKVFIATKCGITNSGDRNFSVDYVDHCLKQSLKRLNTDYIDVFQFAKPQVSAVTGELLRYMENKIREGTIRYFGISVYGNSDGKQYLSSELISFFQIFYNLLFVENDELIENCFQNNKFVIIRSPLNSGVLSGMYNYDTRFDKIDSRSAFFQGDAFRERLDRLECIKKHFKLKSEDVLPFSLNFLFSDDRINVVIPAASDIAQLKQYIRIFNDPSCNILDTGSIRDFLSKHTNQAEGQNDLEWKYGH